MADFMTREEMRLIAQESADRAADRAVSECLLKLGINADDPDAVIEFQRDLSAIRAMASLFSDMKTKGTIAVFLIILTAIVGCVWVGVKSALH
jgi:hypothetical protein